MENLLLILPFLVPVIVANLAERQRGARYATYALLVIINFGLLGVAGLALLNQVALTFMPELVGPQTLEVNWLALALACLLTSLVAFLPLIPAVPRLLARWLPIDPESMVHVTALVFAVYQIGLSLGQMAFIGSVEALIEAGFEVTIWDVLMTGVPLTLFALVGVGLFIRRGGGATLERLGVRRPTWKQLGAAALITILLLAFDFGVNLVWQALDPTGYDQLVRVTDNIYAGLMTVGGAVILGLSAGISEELLFRGAIQPRLGLLLASFLFAVGHVQYGFTVATLEILVIGLALGLVRQRTNTTLCILIHAGYNAAGVLMGLLQP